MPSAALARLGHLSCAALLAVAGTAACRRSDDAAPARQGGSTTVAQKTSGETAQDTIGELADASEACPFEAGAWHCHSGRGVAVRVVAVYDNADTTGYPHVRTLELYPESDRTTRQSLAIEEGWVGRLEPYDVSAADLDGDGYGELRLRHQYGIAANEGHYVWRYEPAARRFAYDSLLSEETNVSPDSTGCVHTFGSVGHAGADQIETRYCLAGGRWVAVWRREQEYDDDTQALTESIYERRGDSLVLVRSGPMRE